MDDETFLDDEIYDDNATDHHPVDDLMVADARGGSPAPGGEGDSDADFDIATLGVEVASMDLAPASCFTPAHLSALVGCDVESLGTNTSLEMRADAAEEDLSAVGALMPRLAQLRMNTSIVPTMRAFGSQFQSLRVLWIARAGVEDLSGVTSLVRLTELYASFNDIADVSPLAEMDFLEVLDLEGNRVEDEDAPDYLNVCPALRELSLEGNPIAKRVSYRREVCVAVKRLRTLDDSPVTDADRSVLELNNADAASADRFAELELVADGIKYAAVGIDDPDAVTTRDDATGELRVALADEALGGALDADAGAGAPLWGERKQNEPALERPGTARALARANSLGASIRGAAAEARDGGDSRRPFTAGGLSRPSTAASWSATRSASRPSTASRPGTTSSSRSGSRERPGTGRSLGSGAGSGSGAAVSGDGSSSSSSFGRLDSLFWRKNQQKETRAGVATGGEGRDDDDARDPNGAASALTRGEGTLVGNPAALLSRRRRAASRERDDADAKTGGTGGTDDAPRGTGASSARAEEDVLDQLRRWKIETAETFSRFAAARRGEAFDRDSVFFEHPSKTATAAATRASSRAGSGHVCPRFAPQPPTAPKPPGAPGGPRRPPACAAAGARPAKRASSALAENAPVSGEALRRRNPRLAGARPVSRPAADRLVLE